ncbi:hypothetical protein KA183_03220 [bacterium]|nr:hypothetical protein [bacterium]
MKSQQILKKMLERYASCKSYQDTGILTSKESNSIPSSLKFGTYFISPDSVFYWLGDQDRRSTIWSKAGKVFTSSGEQVSASFTLHSAFSNFHLYSRSNHFNATLVPSLLMAELKELGELLQNDFKVVSDKEKSDENFQLTSKCHPLAEIRLEICKKEYCLKRITMNYRAVVSPYYSPNQSLIEAEFSEVIFDEPIAEKIFSFVPPEKKEVVS